MRRINLCHVINEKYVVNLIVLYRSILENNKESEIFTYILHSEISSDSLKKLSDFLSENGVTYFFFDLSNQDMSFAPVLYEHISIEAYYKLFIPSLLPANVNRVIYLDIDMIVIGSLYELMQIELNGKPFAAVSEYFVNRDDHDYLEKLKVNVGEYVNTGMIVIDLSVARDVVNLQVCFEYIEKNGENFKFHDQEVLNGLYSSEFVYLEEKYNYLTRFRSLKDFLLSMIKKDKVIIVHYAGRKPWNNNYIGKFGNLYFEYVKMEDGIAYPKKGFSKYLNVVQNRLFKKRT